MDMMELRATFTLVDEGQGDQAFHYTLTTEVPSRLGRNWVNEDGSVAIQRVESVLNLSRFARDDQYIAALDVVVVDPFGNEQTWKPRCWFCDKHVKAVDGFWVKADDESVRCLSPDNDISTTPRHATPISLA